MRGELGAGKCGGEGKGVVLRAVVTRVSRRFSSCVWIPFTTWTGRRGALRARDAAKAESLRAISSTNPAFCNTKDSMVSVMSAHSSGCSLLAEAV